MKTKKVLTASRLRTSESTQLLNFDQTSRAVTIGRRPDGRDSAFGLVGKVCETSSASSALDAGVWLDLAFPHVIGIFGARGSGKSFDLGVIAESVGGRGAASGQSSLSASILIFDVQDQFWTLARAPDQGLDEDKSQIDAIREWGLQSQQLEKVKLWAPAGYKTPLPGVSALQISPSQMSSEDWLSLLSVERFSAIGQALLTLVKQHPSEIPSKLALRCVSGSVLSAFQSSTLEALRWRLESIAEEDLISANGLSLDSFLVPGTASIVLMRQLGDAMRALIVGVITRLVADRMSAHHQEKRASRRLGTLQHDSTLPDRLWLFLDEAHVVVPAGASTAATAPVIDYVKRGRDAGLSLVFATQQPSAVDPKLMSQMDITLTHFLGFEADLQSAVARMPTRASFSYEVGSSKGVDLPNVLRSLDPGECIAADSCSGRVFAMRVRPRVTAHGGNTPG